MYFIMQYQKLKKFSNCMQSFIFRILAQLELIWSPVKPDRADKFQRLKKGFAIFMLQTFEKLFTISSLTNLSSHTFYISLKFSAVHQTYSKGLGSRLDCALRFLTNFLRFSFLYLPDVKNCYQK